MPFESWRKVGKKVDREYGRKVLTRSEHIPTFFSTMSLEEMYCIDTLSSSLKETIPNVESRTFRDSIAMVKTT